MIRRPSFAFAVSLLAVLAALSFTRRARAEPWFGWGDGRVEERYADGDIDTEDLVALSLGRNHIGGGDLRGRSWLTLKGFYAQRPSGLREVGAIVVLGLALDRVAAGPGHRTLERVAFADGAAPPTVAPSPPTPSPPAGSTVTIAPRPFVTPQAARACVAAAWRASGLGVDDARIDTIVSRAHLSALLPETRLRAMRVMDSSARVVDTTTTDQQRFYDASAANLWLEARLTWRLDRLLYADDEPTLERVRIERQDARSRVSARVLDALFLWQRAAIDVLATTDGTREHLEAELRAMEAETTLDVLTAGWFAAWRTAQSAPPRARAVKP
jgi:hypothetical protein